ncbi:hypothetical protein SKAU_G00090720 [Synaphobranchus kaupii]|uniref:Uncharacterized protein n=1 Tax=Synaphobranchus kaupii TaxID=118154 RepID=A0A9Q1FX68_SYNKA|nr:hypothetical protein SKAU_G00090720 [Synaphobranchus kaupii]
MGCRSTPGLYPINTVPSKGHPMSFQEQRPLLVDRPGRDLVMLRTGPANETTDPGAQTTQLYRTHLRGT